MLDHYVNHVVRISPTSGVHFVVAHYAARDNLVTGNALYTYINDQALVQCHVVHQIQTMASSQYIYIYIYMYTYIGAHTYIYIYTYIYTYINI